MKFNKLYGIILKSWKFMKDHKNVTLGCTLLITLTTLLTFLGISPLNSEEYNEQQIMIDKEPHHIGDVNRSFFLKRNCEGTNYSKTFMLTHIGDKMFISISAQHVDPDFDKSPIYIYINDHIVDYLNKYYTEEIIDFETREIEVDNSLFHMGENKISIISGEEKVRVHEYYTSENESIIYEYYIPNIDDICFKDLKILIRDYG